MGLCGWLVGFQRHLAMLAKCKLGMRLFLWLVCWAVPQHILAVTLKYRARYPGRWNQT